MGLVNTDTTATLLKMVAEHSLPADLFVSRTFDLGDIEKAYDVFGRAAESQALEVVRFPVGRAGHRIRSGTLSLSDSR